MKKTATNGRDSNGRFKRKDNGMKKTATNGRDSNGRFKPGAPGGPGRPKQWNKAEYLQALSAEVTPDVWAKIVRRAVQDATEGDSRERASAREWFGKYILPQKLEIETEMKSVSPVHIYIPSNGKE